MVTPSPFDRLIARLAEQATQDPEGAYAQLDAMYGKVLSEQDLQSLVSLAANIGGAGLGRFAETATLLQRWSEYPHINQVGSVWRSLHRALAAMLLCDGRDEEAEAAIAVGVTNASEQCRLAVMTAQTLTACNRATEALPHLKRCASLVQELASDDEVLPVVATIATNVARHAKGQLTRFSDLAQVAMTALVNVHAGVDDWQVQHKIAYQQAGVLLQCGRIPQALDVVGRMLALEAEHDAGPVERYFSAHAACRAQMARGQTKIAKQAFTACESYLEAAPEAAREQLEQAHADLIEQVRIAKQTV